MQGLVTLVIDDQPGARELLGEILQHEGARVLLARDGNEGLQLVQREPVEVLFTDLRLPGCSGVEVFKRARRLRHHLAGVVFTGYASMESVVEALRHGLCDYITKPITRDKVASSLRRARQRLAELHSRASRLHVQASGPTDWELDSLVAQSPAMRRIVAVAKRVAPTCTPVFLQGEPGVGKRLLASTIHRFSGRAEGPFVRVVCDALREEQIESDLFGRASGEAGRTGPAQPGLLEKANGGTLYLEEVTGLPLWAQVQLFDAVQDGFFCRPGTAEPVSLDVRVISSATKNLEEAVAEGRFHRGLYYYLNLVPLRIPPLRQRPEDIRVLATQLLKRAGAVRHGDGHSEQLKFSEKAWECLLQYEWPGNVEELANVVERAVLLEDGNEIALADIQELLNGRDTGGDSERISVPLRGDLRQIERNIIAEVIARCDGNKAAAARLLGMHRRTLYRILESR